MKITLVKDFDFEAAHSQPLFPEGHKCRRVHGHSYKVSISVSGKVDPHTGMFYDHGKITEAMQPLIDQLDHQYLNEIPGLENSTVEMITGWLWQKLAPQLEGLSEIVLTETPRARCIYRGD